MFPEEFVREHVELYTRKGDYVLDPFSGRGTTILESLILGRNAIAVDVNPVAYCVSSSKANPPKLVDVKSRIRELSQEYHAVKHAALRAEAALLHPFFNRAFYHTTLLEVLFLRKALRWKTNAVDRFVSALALGSLHGERDKSPYYFSNQMMRTISTKPDYSLKYWKEHSLWPRKRDTFDILLKRSEFRLLESTPALSGAVKLADARVSGSLFKHLKRKVKLVVTSPPYFNVTNYEEDQWLRLWFLGHSAKPTYKTISVDDRHEDKKRYWGFLEEVWSGMDPLLDDDAVFVCRIGAKAIARPTLTRKLRESIEAVFPKATMIKSPHVSEIKNRQAKAFNPSAAGCLYEVDYTFRVGKHQHN